ncbi:MAG: OmpH family outer membrane protein [Leptolyngbya sp. PLA3]|nr:MAG: OmpH family outer membrane protein [Cyanobacteria bacterium CYA]MCE7968021.1 OmpH family outer membrane protein [Leptolyngbya sp. PL-A3]
MFRSARALIAGLCISGVVGAMLLVAGAGAGRANESRIATVDVIEILQEMLRTETYESPREQMRLASEQELKTLETDIRRLQGELQLIPPEERARGQLMYNELQQKQNQYRQLADQRVREFQALSGEQAAGAYRQIYETAVALGTEAGYTHVLVTQAGAVLDEKETIAMVTQGILARPALLYPKADDLTDRVREKLGYQVPPDEPAQSEPEEGQPGQAEPGNAGEGGPGGEGG